MMGVGGKRLGTVQLFLLLCFGGMVWINLTVEPSWGGRPASKSPTTFSLESRNEPLIRVLERISNATGYEITVSEGWSNRLLTVKLNDLTVEEGLKEILRRLGNPNHLMITNEVERKIEILIVDSISAPKGNKSVGASSTRAEYPSSGPGGRGLTYGQLKAMQEANNQIPTDDMLMIPPSAPGGRGLTFSELDALLEANRDKVPPKDMVLIPPSTSGGKGLTFGELDGLLKANRDKVPPKGMMLIPPSTSGGRGLTFGELDRLLETTK